MPKIPGFMLKAVYVKGSLRADENGCEFKMKNELGPVRIIGVNPLQLDRLPIPLEKCSFVHEDLIAGFKDVSVENSVIMRKGESMTLRIEDSASATRLNRSCRNTHYPSVCVTCQRIS